jgi:para-nitrobenzyl esterase
MEKLWLGATFAAVATVALLYGDPAAAQGQVVSVTGGQIEGRRLDGVTSFKGVPFAAPPVGNLRWQTPQPVRPWSGIEKAGHFAPSCVQDSGFLAQHYGAPATVSEDCLYLNVWTPARSAGEKLPVMVWIYGGAFSGGATSNPMLDGTHFAQRGVVLVSITYRTGVLGFLAHPDLSREQGGRSGNYGILDMIQGLEWVKANIASFGGDPAKVTLFGQSSGSQAVSMLVASPAAHGLFERVIGESGDNFAPARSMPSGLGTSTFGMYGHEGGEFFDTLANAEQYGAGFLSKLDANSIAAARQLSAAEIQKAYESEPPYAIGPVFDGRVLPGDQYVLYEQQRFNDTPVLLGTNSDDSIGFAAPGMKPATFAQQVRSDYGKYADAILAVYPHTTDALTEQSARELFRDTHFGWGAWTWARLQTQYGRNRVFLYYFDYRTPRTPHGAPHGSEVPYVFGNDPDGDPSGSHGPPVRAEDRALSDLMSRYWVNFAKTGDPNGPGLPVWPAFSASDQQAMFLDEHPGARPVPNLQQIRALDAYFAWRREAAKTKPAN